MERQRGVELIPTESKGKVGGKRRDERERLAVVIMRTREIKGGMKEEGLEKSVIQGEGCIEKVGARDIGVQLDAVGTRRHG